MADSAIQWTDATWNPSTGCNAVSDGCKHCYAETLAPRLQALNAANMAAGKRDNGWGAGFKFTEHADKLLEPLRWKRPRRIFTCSMSDLFHERATEAHLDKVWAVMAACPQHSFQVLTKRPQRMAEYLAGWSSDPHDRGRRLWSALTGICLWSDPDGMHESLHYSTPWPLPNVWLGTSVESMDVLRPGWYPGHPEIPGRIDSLLACPAAVRFLSCEPLLGPLDLTRWFMGPTKQNPGGTFSFTQCSRPIDWVIVGGESGTGARPMHPQWARDLRDQCAAAGVAFFMKQFGAWLAASEAKLEDFGPKAAARLINLNGEAISPQLAPLLGALSAHALLVKTASHNGDPAKWPAELADLNIREYPEAQNVG